MRSLLYLITSARALEENPLFVTRPELTQEPEVVLLEEGVRLKHVPVQHVSVIADDLQERGIVSPFPAIGYREMVEKIFAADHVIRL